MTDKFRGIVVDPEQPELDGRLYDNKSDRICVPILPRLGLWVATLASPADAIEPTFVSYSFFEVNWSGSPGGTGFWIPGKQTHPVDYVFRHLVAGYRKPHDD